MNWDDRKDDFDGFVKKGDPEYHSHEFNDGKCVHCGKTREQIRSAW